RRGDQVERARPEAVLHAGQRPYRADLDGVAGEVGLERLVPHLGVAAEIATGLTPEELVPVDVDLLGRGPVHELDERVTGDLLGEPDTAGALDAPLPVQQHLGGDVDGLGEGPLDVAVAGVR